MPFELPDTNAPFARMEAPGFKEEVRERFADWLEERATESDRSEEGTRLLSDLAERVRRGERLPRNLVALEIFRGVFAVGGPMHKRLSQVEVDVLEKDFFE